MFRQKSLKSDHVWALSPTTTLMERTVFLHHVSLIKFENMSVIIGSLIVLNPDIRQSSSYLQLLYMIVRYLFPRIKIRSSFLRKFLTSPLVL